MPSAQPDFCVVYEGWPEVPLQVQLPKYSSELPARVQYNTDSEDEQEAHRQQKEPDQPPELVEEEDEPQDEYPPEEETEFASAFKYALALCTKGNELARDKHYRVACREYNEAVQQIEFVKLSNFHEHGLQQKLLLRLYTNLAVCYMNQDIPKLCCNNCNKIYHMVRGSNLTVPWKVYYNNAKALMALRDLYMAEKRLRMADNLNSGSPEIARLFLKLQKLKVEKKERDRRFAIEVRDIEEMKTPSNDFRHAFYDMCREFNDSTNRMCEFPGALVLNEKEYVNEACHRWGFNVFFTKNAGIEKVVICKRAGM